MALLELISPHLCRKYTVPCPACTTKNTYYRLKPNVYRTRKSDPDGHPVEIDWHTDVGFPPWLTPLNYFWAVCSRCFFTASIDDTDFRTWKKNARKFRGQFREDTLGTLFDLADAKRGVAYKLGNNIPPDDIFGTQIAQFFLGIFTENLKLSPIVGTIARAYLRIAWTYRDEMRLYAEFAPQSKIHALLEDLQAEWTRAIAQNPALPQRPILVASEEAALRQALSFFEWNYRQLQTAKHEDEMRLMILIAEIGYRIYEITGQEEDFTRAQSLFSSTMQKCLGVINDKTIVGGAVNRARDTLEKAGERGHNLRALKKKWIKNPPPAPVESEALPKAPPEKETEDNDLLPAEEMSPSRPSVFDAEVSRQTLRELEQRIAQLSAENKHWMRLAGISEITGLPNRVILSRVLLPSALQQAAAHRENIGCIFLSPLGLQEINGKYGRDQGDAVIRKFAELLRPFVRKNERLCHLEGTDFALLIPRHAPHQLERRAEAIHKDLGAHRFEMGNAALSVKISMGIAGITPDNRPVQILQEALLKRTQQALDRAKLKGDYIEVAG